MHQIAFRIGQKVTSNSGRHIYQSFALIATGRNARTQPNEDGDYSISTYSFRTQPPLREHQWGSLGLRTRSYWSSCSCAEFVHLLLIICSSGRSISQSAASGTRHASISGAQRRAAAHCTPTHRRRPHNQVSQAQGFSQDSSEQKPTVLASAKITRDVFIRLSLRESACVSRSWSRKDP